MSLIFVDVEADFKSPCPGIGPGMTEFGAVEFKTLETFYGRPSHPFSSEEIEQKKWKNHIVSIEDWRLCFEAFAFWLSKFDGRPIFVSDNPAYDFPWINYHFHHLFGKNPMGHSARRIGDFYAGLVGDIHKSNDWKHLRITEHDHNPVHDAMGNVEAMKRMLAGER